MYLSPDNLPFLLVAGAGTGIFGAILGTGGGVFLIPLLVLAFGVEMHYAVATSIITVIATSTAVASANVERGTANMRLGMTLEIATSLGAIAGGLTVALIATEISGRPVCAGDDSHCDHDVAGPNGTWRQRDDCFAKRKWQF